MKQGQFPDVIQLSSLNGQNGFKLDGENAGDLSGFPVSFLGDINADGIDDFIIGAGYYNQRTGRSYVVFGSQDIGGSGLWSLADLDGSNGFKIDGEKTVTYSGLSAGTAGDINGDGYLDIVVGAPYYYGGAAGTDAGRSYVILGGLSLNGFEILSLASLNGTSGFKIDGEAAQDESGHSVMTAGDINHDSYDDLLIGAVDHNNSTGRTYVLFGGQNVSTNPLFLLSNLNGSNGFKLDGETSQDFSGDFLVGVGDVNQDGEFDFLIGARGHNNSTGRSYIVFGGSGVGNTGIIALSNLNGTNGFKLDGEMDGDQSGYSGSGVGDINGDGIPDFIVGAYHASIYAGCSYVIFGKKDLGISGLIALSTLDGENGFKLNGEAVGDLSGISVSGGGDINGDGWNDLLIGSSDHNNHTGRTYVLFGGPSVGSSGVLQLADLNGVNGFKLDGEDQSQAGKFISIAGDVNADGVMDFLIGGDSYLNSTGRTYVVFGDVPPVLVNNQLHTSTGASTTLNSTYLSAYDVNHPNDTLVFIPSGVTHGRFVTQNNPAITLANFTQQQISNGDIQFVHDGTLIAPGYSISVRSTGIAWTGPYLASITFTGVQPSQFPAVVQLANLNGKNGFKLDGETAGDLSGYSVSGAGDVNGDGIDDLIIGAPHKYELSKEPGRSYVVFGGSEVGGNGLLALSSLNGTNGFKLDSETSGDNSGYSVSGAGDINGDGIADVIIGAIGHDSMGVVFGNSVVGGNGLLTLSNLNGTNGFRLEGETNGGGGLSVSGVGDINQDGIDDLIIGSPGYDDDEIGRSYVVFGGLAVGGNGLLTLSSLNGPNGFKLDGEWIDDLSGCSVSGSGDINRDGIADLVIGAYGHNNNTGRSYVVFGSLRVGESEVLTLSSLNGTNGFKLDGEVTGDESGLSVSGAGDINGDGIADVIIGASSHNSWTGRSYVVFGDSTVGENRLLALSSLDGTNGFKLDGEDGDDFSGVSVSGAGDINADGVADLIIGADGHYGATGRSYVVFGSSTIGESGFLSLSSLNGTNGFKLDGEKSVDWSGFSVSGAEDVNGDGIDDLIIGAPNHNNYTGCTYVVFGDVAPQLITNNLIIHQNQTLILNDTNIHATDVNHPAAGLRFNATQIEHGYFSLTNTTQPITIFNQSQLWNAQIQFVHDGSSQPPSYQIQVQSDGLALPPPPQSVNVTFYRSPVLLQNTLLVHQGETIKVNSSDLNVTDDYSPNEVIFTITDLQHGQFQLMPNIPVFQFSQQQLLNDQVFFVQDGNSSSPSYQVSISDPYFTLPSDEADVSFYRQPVIVTNRLTIHQGESVEISEEFLNVTDDYPANEVMWSISNLQYGQFILKPENTSTIQFLHSQLEMGQVWFTQNNSDQAPSYEAGVSDPYFTLPPADKVEITFYRAPVITANNLLIHQGETVILTSESLSAIDDYSSDEVNFLISNPQQGQFQLLPQNTSLTQFTEEQLLAGLVAFKQDGSNSTPAYQVGIKDPYFTLPATSSVTTTFYRQPVFITNQLSVVQGQTVLFNSSMLDVSDDYPDTEVSFLIENIQHGQFKLIPNDNSSTVQFTQEQVKTGQIQFVHDNTSNAPSYNVTVSDEFFTVGPQAATIDFDAQPVLETNQLTINQGQTIPVTAENLYASHSTGPESELSFIISNYQHGHFAWTNSPSQSITIFQQQNITDNRVQFIHDNSVTAPSYDVIVTDGRINSPIQAASIDFDTLPILEENTLWIDQGQTVVLNSTNLKASHDGEIDPNLSFLISNSQHGHFQWTNTSSVITSFQQENITKGLVSFTHDNSRSPPSYLVSTTDGRAASSPKSATIYFNGMPEEQSSISLGVILGAALGGAVVIVAGCLYARYKYRQNKKKSELHLQSTYLSFPLLEETSAEVPAIALEDLKYNETKNCIGSGAYASVYQGVYQDKPVAIKRLHAHHISEKALKEFKQEAGIMASVSSEFVVQLRGVCFERSTACIIMELMPKYSLYQVLSNSPNLSLPVLLQIGLDVIHGLQDLHIKNILHRDLKSLNVLLDDRLRAKVSDFGMSKLQSEIGSGLSSQASIKGTLLWAAPELFDEKPKYSKAADIYAYGLILWELMVKPYRTPFSNNVDLTYEWLRREKLTRKDQEAISSDWSKPLVKLMRECWDKKPHKRPSAAVVAKSLEQIFAAEQKAYRLIPGPSGMIGIDSGVPLTIGSSS